jgi:hypothetical protein
VFSEISSFVECWGLLSIDLFVVDYSLMFSSIKRVRMWWGLCLVVRRYIGATMDVDDWRSLKKKTRLALWPI